MAGVCWLSRIEHREPHKRDDLAGHALANYRTGLEFSEFRW